uniref:Uncharacterized protein n=1 Tax=Xenopus tropicalis TaxID=8364 RepID=A0A1B8Y8X6_XENTR
MIIMKQRIRHRSLNGICNGHSIGTHSNQSAVRCSAMNSASIIITFPHCRTSSNPL